MVKKGHRKMQKGTPLINDWDVVLWQNATSPTRRILCIRRFQQT